MPSTAISDYDRSVRFFFLEVAFFSLFPDFFPSCAFVFLKRGERDNVFLISNH